MPAFDIVVIGGGIAGASVAAHLVPERRVLILEAEAQAGYHSTGRSAALFSETYGGPVVRALSRASRSFLFHPPAGFAENPLVTPRGTLFIASPDQREALAALARELDMAAATRPVDPAEALSLCPILAPDNLAAALLAPGTADIDVDGLHQGFLRLFRARGGTIRTDLSALEIAPTGQGWSVTTREGAFEAGIVVDAAGAWADKVAALAGVPSIGLRPLRRTALVVAAPDGARIADWPMVIDAAEQFYFKPDAGRLILSPADETPSEPCDAQAEEWDVAVAVDRFERATTARIGRIERRWAGLRSFVSDRSPVAGFDPAAPGFFWLAGQGGYGLQTAPALGRAAAALVLERDLPSDLVDEGVTADLLSRARPALASRSEVGPA